MAGKRTEIIDKTAAVEEMIQTSAAVCLCGMPGVGKKTLVRHLREKHPEKCDDAGQRKVPSY